MPQPPVTISPTLYMEDDSQWLIENLQPIPQANHIRQQILDFLNQLIRPKMPTEEVQLLICGSTCSRTYLPDSDIDLTLITPNSSGLDSSHSSTSSSSSGGNHNNHMKYLIDLSTTFIEEIYRRDRDRDAHNETSWKLSSASGESIEQDFPIRNVEFINARVKLLHCVVRNVGIDITVNQRGAIGSLLFIEEADKVVGCDHLLKKSIVLIKVKKHNFSSNIVGITLI
jgi:DNA polymerase sigma